MNAPSEPSPPLNPDDPRLSEWIDGRLSPPEAAAVERAVNRSPELARLVADLRAVKAAARQATAASPPPGFADRVMAAVVAERAVHDGGGSDPSDRLVEAEWRAIEAERIAEERTEAAADLEEEIGPVRAAKRPTWPWLTIATALAAGLLVTVVLNVPRPDPGPVEVALLTDREAEPRDRNRALSKPAEDKAAGQFEGGGKGGDAGAVAPADAVAAGEPQRAARQRLEKTGAEAEQLADPIEVMVRGPEGRAKLLAQVASLGLTAMPTGAEVLELVGPEEAVAAFLADPLGAPPSAKGLPVPGQAALLASEARDGEAKPAWSDGGPEERSGELARATPDPTAVAPDTALAADRKESLRARGAAAAPPAAAPVRRILIRVVELPAAGGEPSEP
jgi:hypothetical protein